MVERNPTALLSPSPPRARIVIGRPEPLPLTPRSPDRRESSGHIKRNSATRAGAHLVILPPLSTPLAPQAPARQRRRASVFSLNRLLARLLRGDSAVITTFVACTGVVCLLGTAYLASYAKVAREEAQIHSLQQNLAAAQARHEALVQDLARLQSASRVSALARQMDMVPSGPSEYVGAPAGAGGAVDQVALAR